MRKLISIFMLCFSLIASAQTDEKYLTGAVPLIGGKVEFSTELQVPAMSQQQI